MGISTCLKQGLPEVCPAHVVSLDAFYINKYETTVEQYRDYAAQTEKELPQQIPHNHPDHPVWDKAPVVNVTWQEANDFCSWVGLRLPTEAEWEKAARGGTTTRWHFGDNPSAIYEYAWIGPEGKGNAGDKVHTVGRKKPNPYGLYDMYGNADEWVSDWVDYDYYSSSPKTNPKGPTLTEREARRTSTWKILRGGSWASNVQAASSFLRGQHYPNSRHISSYYAITHGFRCAGDVK